MTAQGMTVRVAATLSTVTEEGEFHRSWRVVFASAIGICLGFSPMPIYTIGVFAPHMIKEFGWSISEIMASLTVTTIAILGAAPLTGWLSNRYGVRRVVLTSQILFGLSFMSIGLSTGSLPLFYACWAVATFAGAGTLPITFTRSINTLFEKRKGLALGLAMMGTGVFGMLCKPLLAVLIPAVGWRGSYFALGLLPIVVAFPVAYLFLRGPGTGRLDRAKAESSGLSLSQTLREWRFWLLLVLIFPVSLALGGPVPNLETMLTDARITPSTILALTPMIGFSALVGRIVGGWLLDRFWAPSVGCVILCLPAVSCYMLAGSDLTGGTAAIAVFMIGFALGIEHDLIAYMVSRYFGMRAYSPIYSILYVAFALGSGTGPMLLGWDRDVHGRYSLSLLACSVALVVCAFALLALGRYRKFHIEAETPAID